MDYIKFLLYIYNNYKDISLIRIFYTYKSIN